MRAAWVAIFLFACTASREVLPRLDAAAEGPPRRKYPFCPTKIDVYGGPNVLLSGSGGPSQPPASLPDGASTPGTAEYDNSLASELRDFLVQDTGLQRIFGTNWRVRSCASPRGSLTQFSPPLVLDNCGPDSPTMLGQLAAMCTNDPAPVLIMSAENVDDRCHGGGVDSGEGNDLNTFSDHFARRLNAFLDGIRNPKLALIGPQTEWIPLPFQSGGPSNGGGSPPTGPDLAGCRWLRSDWNIVGVDWWSSHRSSLIDVVVVPDLHDEFKRHHPSCCGLLGVGCDIAWYAISGDPQRLPTALNDGGAAEMIKLWANQLKAVLLANDFTCEGDAGAQ